MRRMRNIWACIPRIAHTPLGPQLEILNPQLSGNLVSFAEQCCWACLFRLQTKLPTQRETSNNKKKTLDLGGKSLEFGGIKPGGNWAWEACSKSQTKQLHYAKCPECPLRRGCSPLPTPHSPLSISHSHHDFALMTSCLLSSLYI